MKSFLLLTTLFLMQTLAVRAGSIHDIAVKDIDGKETTLGAYKGKVLLIVNVASKCGLTPQYEGLEALYRDYRDRGLVVLGFPANDFGAQEPGTEAVIVAFCTANFRVKFPMFSKIEVTGQAQHPLYRALTAAQPKARWRGVRWPIMLSAVLIAL